MSSKLTCFDQSFSSLYDLFDSAKNAKTMKMKLSNYKKCLVKEDIHASASTYHFDDRHTITRSNKTTFHAGEQFTRHVFQHRLSLGDRSAMGFDDAPSSLVCSKKGGLFKCTFRDLVCTSYGSHGQRYDWKNLPLPADCALPIYDIMKRLHEAQSLS